MYTHNPFCINKVKIIKQNQIPPPENTQMTK